MENWKLHFQAELDQAKAARAEGKEGMARVCARRATGIASAEYLRRHSQAAVSSAYENIQRLLSLNGISPDVRAVGEHFLLKVNEDHRLPVEADLIAEASWLAEQLLGDID